MTIFGRVLCPLQPSCLPPPHAARALLLSFFPSVVDPLSSVFSPLLLSTHFLSYHSFSLLLSPTHPVTALFLSFLPKPAPSVHPPSSCFTPLCGFLCSCPSHYFLCSLYLPYPSPAGSCGIQVYFIGCAQGAWAAGLWPILALALCPAAGCAHVCKFINVHTFSQLCGTFFCYVCHHSYPCVC